VAIELIVKSKALAEAVESMYRVAYAEQIPNGGWAILGQVWAEPTGKGARIKMTMLPKHFADQISAVLERAANNGARKRKRTKSLRIIGKPGMRKTVRRAFKAKP
jgi:hypothetical protein